MGGARRRAGDRSREGVSLTADSPVPMLLSYSVDHSILENRLTELSNAWCSAEYTSELWGFSLEADEAFCASIARWSKDFLGVADIKRGSQVHRHAIESYFVDRGLVPMKWAAADLGMNVETFERVVENERFSILRDAVSERVVRRREAAQMFRAFPNLRHRVFQTHEQMCTQLHRAIKDALSIEVTPLYCATSEVFEGILDPKARGLAPERELAVTFDALTLEPLGLHWQVLLDTKKPLHLQPDVCSLKTYLEHEDFLRLHLLAGANVDQDRAQILSRALRPPRPAA